MCANASNRGKCVSTQMQSMLNLMVLLCFHSYATRTIVINCFVLIFTFCLGNLKNQKVSETKEKMKR